MKINENKVTVIMAVLAVVAWGNLIFFPKPYVPKEEPVPIFSTVTEPFTVEGDEGFRTSTEPRPIWPVTVYRYPPDSSIAMTTDAWHTWCSQDGALTRFALPLGHNPPLAGRLKYLQLGGR